jgi:long-subunit fatty acid transport protein
VGITSVPFLMIEPDSRAAGMGHAGVALADNASAVFWNPAGLAWQQGNQVSITHASWLPSFNADLFYDYLVGKFQVEGVGMVGAHLAYLNLGEQVRTDAAGFEQGRFNSYELAGGLSYGFQLSERWALGAGLRFIYSSLAGGAEVSGQSVRPGSSIGVDLAVMYRSADFDLLGQQSTFNAGLNLSNIGPGLRYTDNTAKDPLPTVLRVGWALTTSLDNEDIHTLTLANDYSKVMARTDSEGNPDGAIKALFSSWGSLQRETGQGIVSLPVLRQFMVATGLEYWYNELFALRGGYYFEDPHNGDRRFLTLGAGLRYGLVGVDFSYLYALEEDHPLANTTRFGLLLNF